MVAGVASAQTLDLTKQYQVLARKDVKKMQRDLNKAGQNGIRVVTGNQTGGEELIYLLEKDQKNESNYEYLIVSAGELTKLEQALSRGARQGFRLVPGTITLKSKKLGSGDIVMLLEKGPRTEGSYEYLLLDASLPSSMAVTLASSVDQGYRAVSMLKKGKQMLLVLEKHGK